jgi:LEA14-like dessication related protein
MFLSRRRVVLIAVVAAVIGAIILLPLITTVTLPNLENVRISLAGVQVMKIDPDTNVTNLKVIFDISNPTDTTLTTSKIEYQLSADGKPLGQGISSYEDIPVNGRPQLSPKSSITLPASFDLTYSASNADIIKKIQQNQSGIKWNIDGTIQLESAFSSSPKQFTDQIQK